MLAIYFSMSGSIFQIYLLRHRYCAMHCTSNEWRKWAEAQGEAAAAAGPKKEAAFLSWPMLPQEADPAFLGQLSTTTYSCIVVMWGNEQLGGGGARRHNLAQ